MEWDACEVFGCNGHATWWTCSNCGAHCCHKHQSFTGLVVASCAICQTDPGARIRRMVGRMKEALGAKCR